VDVAQAFGQTKQDGFDLSGAPAFLGFALVLLYFIVMEATLGATLGKLIVKLRVVNEADGTPIGWSAAVCAMYCALSMASCCISSDLS